MHDRFHGLAVADHFHFDFRSEGEREVFEALEFSSRAEVEFGCRHALGSAFAVVKADQRIDFCGVIASAVFELAFAGFHAHDLDDLIESHDGFFQSGNIKDPRRPVLRDS